MKVSVSYLKSPYSVAETILKLNETSCDFLHVDLMDGVFAGTNNYDQESVFQELHLSTKPLDIHLMMVNPAGVIQTLASLHPSYITIPVEILQDDQLISLVKSYGIKCGLALNPDTPIESLIPFLDKIDLVLLMSVYPGKGGQKFLEGSVSKAKALKEFKSRFSFVLAIDGGINEETISLVDDYVDQCVSGSYVCMADSMEKQIEALKKTSKF